MIETSKHRNIDRREGLSRRHRREHQRIGRGRTASAPTSALAPVLAHATRSGSIDARRPKHGRDGRGQLRLLPRCHRAKSPDVLRSELQLRDMLGLPGRRTRQARALLASVPLQKSRDFPSYTASCTRDSEPVEQSSEAEVVTYPEQLHPKDELRVSEAVQEFRSRTEKKEGDCALALHLSVFSWNEGAKKIEYLSQCKTSSLVGLRNATDRVPSSTLQAVGQFFAALNPWITRRSITPHGDVASLRPSQFVQSNQELRMGAPDAKPSRSQSTEVVTSNSRLTVPSIRMMLESS